MFVSGLIGAMLAAILTSIVYECIHEYLRYLRHKALTKEKRYMFYLYLLLCMLIKQKSILMRVCMYFGYFK